MEKWIVIIVKDNYLKSILIDDIQFKKTSAQIDEEKKLEEFRKRQEEQIRIERLQRRRQHPSYISRFDEKRYVASIRKK